MYLTASILDLITFPISYSTILLSFLHGDVHTIHIGGPTFEIHCVWGQFLAASPFKHPNMSRQTPPGRLRCRMTYNDMCSMDNFLFSFILQVDALHSWMLLPLDSGPQNHGTKNAGFKIFCPKNMAYYKL